MPRATARSSMGSALRRLQRASIARALQMRAVRWGSVNPLTCRDCSSVSAPIPIDPADSPEVGRTLLLT
jgi:hypothetical protein